MDAPSIRQRLLPVAEAQARLLTMARVVSVERVTPIEAIGRWVAEPVLATRTQPAADLSAMDGYAIRFADLPGPWRLIGESAAGRASVGSVDAGEAVRIFTGAAMPTGADTVMIQEEVTRDGDRVVLDGEGPLALGRNTRRRGLDFAKGDTLVRAGDRLTPARLGLVATGGATRIAVRRRVRVAIVATGDELVDPSTVATGVELPESNRLLLRALLTDLPVEIVDLGILPDRLETLRDAFAAIDADLLVTTGGASVGDHDLVRPALEAAGGVIDFWRIALRPGKPMLAGRRQDMMMLGLPGNPVSAFVTALLFVKPLVAAMAGARDPLPHARTVMLGEDLPANGPRTDYMRAEVRDGHAYVAAIQDSSMLATLARANALLMRAPNAVAARAGESAEILDIA